jgi:hypothetical protein
MPEEPIIWRWSSAKRGGVKKVTQKDKPMKKFGLIRVEEESTEVPAHEAHVD